MATKRKVIEAYYNVDHNYWSNSKGDFIPTSGIPRLAFGLNALLKLHLIHADGSEVTDFDDSVVPHFAIFSESNVLLVEAGGEDINNAEALELWEADPTKGQFAVLLNCNTTQLQDALTGWECRRYPTEFIVLDVDSNLIGQYEMLVYCDSTQSATLASVDVIIAKQKTGTVTIQEGDAFSLVESDPSLYSVTSAVLEAPADATDNYSVTSVELASNGFKVFYNATILTAGYVLRYTLTKKG